MRKSLSCLFIAAALCAPTVGLPCIPTPPALAADIVTAPKDPMGAAIADANAAVARIVALADKDRTFDNTIGAIDDVLANFEYSVSMFIFMSNVHPDAAIREASQAAEEKYNNFLIELSQREDLYRAVKAYAATNPALAGEQARLLAFTLRDYRRSGMDLTKSARDRLGEVRKEIGRLVIDFNKNIADDETTVPLVRDELRGVSAELLARVPHNGGVYMVGMAYPVYIPIMETCEVEATRQKLWMAYKRRAGKKNVAVLEKVLALRAEEARLLGYKNNAEYEIEVRMAKTPKAVDDFYARLRPLAREKAKQDFAEFTAAKREQTKDPAATLKPWDSAFIKNYLQKTKYAVDGETVRQYFPMEAAVDGLFKTTQTLYGLEYRDVTATRGGTPDRPLWHPDVTLFEVWDKASHRMLGEFYLDMYPRDNKYTHAAQWGLVQHKVWRDGHVSTPLAALVCNFTKPTADKPSLLQHSEVETFFHEFGHCLHTIVSESHHFRFGGTSVERDFVEAPSQMFENWVWDAQVLNTFARHYKTGEPLPRALLDSMIAAKNLGSGLDAEQQFYYALLDLAYESTSDGVVDTTKIATDLFPQVTMYDFRPEGTYFQASFGHLMHYNAGYYGYMWSKVFACDMAKRFKELGMLDPKAGMEYRRKVISRGGTSDAMDLITDFLGREPRLDAFVEALGLKK
ncbi:MAG TPA: M3 family metallopeptidase [Phycisphaerales bacterium]|nr:M3 family metallopeptidase [Phycisphaerales bacterium]